jgi:hypothetical protein
MVDYQEFRIAYEITSTILCLILVRFMIKPYQLTGESRYLGLPLGFGFLGATYALSALIYYQPLLFGAATYYIQLVSRAFAFVFLCVTYYFSNKPMKNTRWVWNATFAVLIVALITAFILVSIPEILPAYSVLASYVRFFNLIFIGYLCYRTFRSHIERPDPETLWIFIGYLFLGISQYSLIIYTLDSAEAAWWGALGIRWAGFAVFLYIAYKSFCSAKGREVK